MAVYRVEDMSTIEKLFTEWEETLIWSCLRGHMGEAYADDLMAPRSAQIIVADFCFFAGVPCKELVDNRAAYEGSEFLIMIPQHPDWDVLIEDVFGEQAVRRQRYATLKEKHIFDHDQLQRLVEQLPEPYVLEEIDQSAFGELKQSSWAGDLVGQFDSYEVFRKHGLGYIIRKDAEIVSGAGTYTFYDQGIEIEIDTLESERRKGLARVCGARLILGCLERGLYPSWDAHNRDSLALAEQLGYHFDKAYTAYDIFL